MELTPKQLNIMRLVRRSTPVEGWYKVSDMVWPVVESAELPTDLVETKHDDGHYLRLTPNGEVVMQYLF